MKKILLLVLLLLLVGVVAIKANKMATPPSPASPSSTSSPVPEGKEIEYKDKLYISYTYFVPSLQGLALQANFAERKQAADLKKQFGCEFLINGGFYDTSNRPIGWWKSGSEILAEKQTNALFNGFFYLEKDKVEIDSIYPDDAIWGVQTGPILIIDSKPRKLAIKNDEMRRRMVAGIDSEGELVFFAFTLKNSSFEGPYLEDLPEILELVNLDIAEAINLDGGTASAFLSPDVQLTEANPIGSFFCHQSWA